MIRLSKSSLDEQEIAAVSRVLRKEHLGMGQEVRSFEEELAGLLNVENDHVTVVNSGTSALILALSALDIGPGDEVLVPTITYVASFQAVAALGAKPVACDVNEDTLFLDSKDAERRITNRTRAVMPVHYASNCEGLEAVYELANRHGLRVVEDAAHAFGGRHQGSMIGKTGDLVCFSFDGIKNITSGEGGAVICRDSALLARLKDGRLLGVERDSEKRFAGLRSWDFEVRHVGYRMHMSDVFAAIGRVQLSKLDERIGVRRQRVQQYLEALQDVSSVTPLPFDYERLAPHIFVVRIRNGVRDQAMEQLKSEGIECGIHYKPNHLLHLFRSPEPLPAAELAYDEILTLPLHNDLTPAEVIKISRALIQAVP